MTMKRIFIIITTVFSLLVLSTQTADAQFLRGLLRACGVSDDSSWMKLADVGDGIINATSAKSVDSVIGTYGKDAANNYDNFVNDYNSRKERELKEYLSEVDQFKMEYCKSHGFYDSWVEKYGEEWFDRRGREWFDSQNEAYIRRTGGDNLLPWHLRGEAREETRYEQLDNFRSTALGSVGLSNADVDRYDRFVSGDKYDKQDMIIDAATDVITGFAPDNAKLVSELSNLIKVNNQYNKNKGSDRSTAIAQRNIDLANIVFDAAWEKNENRKLFVANSLDLSSVLSDAGFEGNSDNANDLAGVVLSIQNNESMTQEEKNQWYNDLGIKSNTQTVVNTINMVNSMTDQQIAQSLKPVDNGPSPEEIRAKEEAERLERERIVKENAVSTVNQTVVDSYKFDITDLTEEQKEDLDNIAETMSKYADLKLEIKGHTCNIGYKSVNERVGLRRAEAAKTYLVEKGIFADRIITATGGENEPIVENTTSDNRKHNRRLTFEIQ